MNSGKVIEKGLVQEVFAQPSHQYTKHLLGSEPKGKPAPVPSDAKIIFETHDLKSWFPIQRGVLKRTVGHIKAVDGVTLSIHEGETIGVVGESGSGKTTLGMSLLRLQASEGPIIYQGLDLQGLRFRETRKLRNQMQIVFQDPFGSLSPRMSMAEIIGEGLRVHSPSEKNLESEVDFDERIDPRDRKYYWMTGEMVDNDKGLEYDGFSVANGYASITPINFEMTNMDYIDELKRVNKK